MIIKSMPRKEASFFELMNYMLDVSKSDEKYFFGFNIFVTEPKEICKAFQANAKHVKQRKNGNYLYHEIISIKCEEGVEREKSKEALQNIAHEYMKLRASKNMAFGALHDDHEGHLHYHVMISANEIGSAKKTRLLRQEFHELKKTIESYTITHHPELKQSLLIGKSDEFRDKQKDDEKTNEKTNAEVQIEKQRGKQTKVSQLGDVVGRILETAQDENELRARLKHVGLVFYTRGNTHGIIDESDGKKYRLKRLGVDGLFEKLLARGEQKQETKQTESKQPKEQKSHEPEENERMYEDQSSNTPPDKEPEQTHTPEAEDKISKAREELRRFRERQKHREAKERSDENKPESENEKEDEKGKSKGKGR